MLGRKIANKLSVYDLDFISATLRRDRSYNFGALIAFRLALNREKNGICGGLSFTSFAWCGATSFRPSVSRREAGP